ncbi:MAG TPA: pyruvate, phosphate dikinase [Thermoleophilia bacterium]|nr:pyruvate, phosphate dikinase [Thermoleophilia bacterium]HQG04161.1 pyruvate, phosphate dikinase [Thermoleophilia bacterium]HQJ98613.1 pyruvate, phosphate dikinase [Thermoleophilia bacterium]
MTDKYVYRFREGDKDMKALLGGKGANLAEMTRIGLPVPPGFTVTTEVCNYYSANGTYPEGLEAQVEAALAELEDDTGKRFGDGEDPLLLSVRSGARASMPGMMDTILNLGLNDTTVQGLIAQTGNPRFAYDCYRRFVAMYGDVVLGCKPVDKDEIDPFEQILDEMKQTRGAAFDTDLTADDLKELVGLFKGAVKERTGHDFPDDPREQLWGAIGAVFGSWDNDRAVAYRRLYGIPDTWGTAVNIQVMVFGNTGDDSGTGVAFTRDPATGENVFYGEFLVNAQGEDVVAGVRTPRPVTELAEVFPEAYAQLLEVRKTLERELRDMQDFEFTIERGRLYMLQTRNGKRTGLAAIRIAVDMCEEGLITADEALMRIEPEQLNQLLRPVFSRTAKQEAVAQGRVLARGLAAGPGAASGRVVFNAPDAEAWAARGEKVILARLETSPEDIRGMDAAEGILTARGGMTSHAALVARQMGKVAVVGCEALDIDYRARTLAADGKVVKEGDWLSIDGFTGEVILGQLETRHSEVLQVILEHSLKPEDSDTFKYYDDVMKWADAERRLGVRANADQPDQAANAIAFGAEGIGLCRTEHMFFGGDRITAVREMILADDTPGRERALAKLLPMQRDDFVAIFRVMGERPVTIRTLDPPLHEFVPHDEAGQAKVAAEMGVDPAVVKAKVEDLREANPMLGHRGCRLGIAYPEITRMQARAILEAACIVKKEGVAVRPEIMIPLVGARKELEHQEKVVRGVAAEVFAEQGVEVDYLVGTMIEVPRAALTADEIAEVAEFFSFGTNDLTQMTLGVSRDDAGKFLPLYTSEQLEIWPADPFETLDQDGVGQLVRLGIERGRATRAKLKVGICGEQGGDPATVKFCHRVGMDYVSCSPFRLPVARLAAAQAALEERSALELEK